MHLGLNAILKEMIKKQCSDDTIQVLCELQETVDLTTKVLNNLLSAEKLKKGLLQFEMTFIPAFTLILDSITPYFFKVNICIYYIYISYIYIYIM